MYVTSETYEDLKREADSGVSYHIIDLKWQNRLKVGTDKPRAKS